MSGGQCQARVTDQAVRRGDRGRRASRSRSSPASSSRCWGPAAAARPPRCGWSRASSRRPTARSCSTAPTSANLAAQPPQRQHGLSELRAVPVSDRRRERRVRHEVQVGAQVRAATTRVAEALELVQLSGYEKRRPNQLSGGQQQRVALARALVLRPSVLLLDEPLGALDAKLRRTLQVELGALQKQVGITFLYVTHDQEEALTMSDRLAVMNHGRIVQLGTPEEVYNEPADAYVADFLGVSNLMDAQVEPGGDGSGPCRLRMGDFTLDGRGGPARRHRRGQARDPPRAHPPATVRGHRRQPRPRDGRAPGVPRLDHPRLRPPGHRHDAADAGAQRRAPRCPIVRGRRSASRCRPTRCACCPIPASAWPRSTRRRRGDHVLAPARTPTT